MTEEILERQREFFLSGKTLDVKFRKRTLQALRQGILDMEDRIAGALKEDLGKSGFESYMCETGMVLSELGHAIRHIEQYSRPHKARTPLAQFPARSYMIPEPYGNVLIMSPWNYPFLLTVGPLASAVAAGNTAILKPSAYSPATSRIIKELISNTFSPGHVAVIEGGREVNADLLDRKFDYIFFTGSKEVGKLVMSKASAHLTPVTLELGGKSPVIIDATADIAVSARRIVFGKYLNCGQTCVAPDYVFVHESVGAKFMDSCITEIERMFGRDAMANVNYGKTVNRKHFDRLRETLEDAADKGAKTIYGGHCDAESLKIEPTILDLGELDSANEDRLGNFRIMQEEIFGPLMPVIRWKNLKDAVRFIEQRPKPLATYIFTSDRKTKRHLLGRLHFGGGCVNDTIIHLATENMPFGGLGESGMGAYHGRFGFETFSHFKSIVDKPFWMDLPMRYQPYTRFHEKLVRMFLK